MARVSGLVTERIGGELVVYDGETHEAHCLQPLARAVFDAADGHTSSADMARIASDALDEPVGVSDVDGALDELEACGLLVPTGADGISRRSLMKRGAAVGGATVAASLITSVTAPAAFAAGSLPSGVPQSGYSSLAIQFECVNTNGCCTNPNSSGVCVAGTANAPDPYGTYYGAHWNAGAPTGAPPSGGWGAVHANANCVLPKETTSSAAIPNVSSTAVSGGLFVSVPAGYDITGVAAFWGKGAVGACGAQQCLTLTSSPDKLGESSGTGGYTISFPADCY